MVAVSLSRQLTLCALLCLASPIICDRLDSSYAPPRPLPSPNQPARDFGNLFPSVPAAPSDRYGGSFIYDPPQNDFGAHSVGFGVAADEGFGGTLGSGGFAPAGFEVGGPAGQFGPPPTIPETSFSCGNQQYPGYYADIETDCQVFHICQHDGRHDSFLCPAETRFNQEFLVCDWPSKVDCFASDQFFGINAEIGKVPERRSHGGGIRVDGGNFGGPSRPPSTFSDPTFAGGSYGGYV